MDLATQRRIWVAAIPALVITANALGFPLTENLLATTGDQVVAGVMAVLSLWSYLAPKPQ